MGEYLKSCFFIGHSNAPSKIRDSLAAEVERHITQNSVSHFIVGGYGAFDAMAARAVKAAKIMHPEITLLLLLPYHPAERPIPTPEGFDGTYYPFERPVPHRFAIVKANRMMIDTCDYLIAYAAYPGNSRNLLDYARRRFSDKPDSITNLALVDTNRGGRY